VVHQRLRLGILSIAHEARRVEFSYLRTNLDLTAGDVSQHRTVLESAGPISIEEGYEGRRARTWVSLIRAGRTACKDAITNSNASSARSNAATTPRTDRTARPSPRLA
jgi:DNA-binding MarR family transcriptional regulator